MEAALQNHSQPTSSAASVIRLNYGRTASGSWQPVQPPLDDDAHLSDGSFDFEYESDYIDRLAQRFLMDDAYPDMTPERARAMAEAQIEQESGE